MRGPLLSSLLADDSTRAEALRAWKGLVDQAPGDPVDLVPWNVIATDDGPVAIDQEWQAKDYPRNARIARGTSVERRAIRAREQVATGRRSCDRIESARSWASEASIELTDADISTFIDHESAFQEFLAGPARAEGRSRLEALLACRLRDVRGATRIDLDDPDSASAARNAGAMARAAVLEQELAKHQAHKEQADAAHASLEAERLRMERSYLDLEAKYRVLESSYVNLEAAHRDLEAQCRGLETSRLDLETAYRELETSRRDVETSYRELETSYRQLETAYHELEKARDELETNWNAARESPVRFAFSAMRHRQEPASPQADPPPAP